MFWLAVLLAFVAGAVVGVLAAMKWLDRTLARSGVVMMREGEPVRGLGLWRVK